MKDWDKKAPVGIRNNNPGNLVFMTKDAFEGQEFTIGEGGFGRYMTMVKGVRASCKNLLSYFRHDNDTVREIVTRWSETDQEEYIKTVCDWTGWGDDELLTPDPETLFNLLRCIFRVENGGWFVSDGTIWEGIREALGGSQRG